MTGFFNISDADTRQIHRKQSELEDRTGQRWRVRITQGFATPRVLHILVDGENVADVSLPVVEESPVHIVCAELEREAMKPRYLRTRMIQ